MHTSMGDIHLRLYPEECPKTVENFTTHCRNGYYDNLIFHRVIKGFMIQTGDPLGDGTGGQSIWGREFEDEFHKRYISCMPFPVFLFSFAENNAVFHLMYRLDDRCLCKVQERYLYSHVNSACTVLIVVEENTIHMNDPI